MTHDRLPGNTLDLTHEFLALMLAVRRAGVTEALKSAWERYREYILLICGALLFQSALIGFLAYEHRRRHLAERDFRHRNTRLRRCR